VIHGSTIYVFGGWRMNGAGKEPEWYDHGLTLDLENPQRWEPVKQPFQRRALGVAAVAGKIAVVGGLTEDAEADPTVNLFDPKNRTWTTGPALPGGKRNAFSPAVWNVGDRLYASAADGVVRELAADFSSWREVGKQTHARLVHRLVPWNDGGLLVLGGSSAKGNVAACEIVVPAR
jgi:hypothetical protein